jgi:glycosyltransferase involved in cell wall biosynthesis
MSLNAASIPLRHRVDLDAAEPWDFPMSRSALRLAEVVCPVDLEILVPALNEEHRIGATLEALMHYLMERQIDAIITVIDNGSSDRTVDIVGSFAGSPIPINVIGCARRGKGAAVRKAVLQSAARWVGFCDADLSTPVETLDAVLDLLREGHEVVVASRRCPGAVYAVKQSMGRRLGSCGFRRLTAAYAPTVSDTQCGFKFFARDTARDIFDRALIDGFAFDIEVLGLAHGSGKAIAEVPVVWRDAPGSSFRPWKDGRRVARDVLELRKRFARELVQGVA